MAVTAFLCYVAPVLLTLAISILRYRLNYWKAQGIPHDVPSLLHGNLTGLGRTCGVADIVRATYLKFKGTGPFCGFYFFQRPVALVLDTQLAKSVLVKDFANFTDRGLFHNEADDPLTGHLFLLDGQRWRDMRSKLSAFFTPCKMKQMLPLVIGTGERLVAALQQRLDGADVIEVRELLTCYTTDVASQCTFGLGSDALGDSRALFRSIGRQMLTLRRHAPLVTRLIQSWPQLARRLHARLVPDGIHKFFLRLVGDLVTQREQGNGVPSNDFVSLLMRLDMSRRGLAMSTQRPLALTVPQISGQAFAFFGAAFDMAAQAMACLLYELALQPALQMRVRAEINDALAQHSNAIGYEFIRDLPYMEQVIAETLRKYPVLPHLMREAAADYAVPGHPGYVIRKGVAVLIPAVGIHHDPDFYPEPQRFDPERFAPAQVQARASVEWLAYGDGPRNCIARRFAQIQMRVGLSLLLRQFHFSVCAETESETQQMGKCLALATQNGIHLKVKAI